MDYVAHMQGMLKVLGCYRPPRYESRDIVVNGVKQGVMYTLSIKGIPTEDGPKIMSLHVETRRESTKEAIQETARLAILHLAMRHAAELRRTVFRLYPAASKTAGAAPVMQHPLVEGDQEDAAMAQLASFALAQACFAHRTAAELGRRQVALDATLERIAQLERTQAAQLEKIAEQSGALHVAGQRIDELEKAFFAGSPRDEDLVLEEEEEAPPVQEQQKQQPEEEEDAKSQAPEQSEPLQEKEEAAAAPVGSAPIVYIRLRRRDGM
jgi:hypothetical protein